ncbi:hypothetical protein [Burkholderia gladioli]|uniref:hypothetical protein n=1 Tax=Burkholderia gladioli TaxID=28095 RepID=UPI0011B29ABB|nr:hypothetical protein [Burkholderia gladioli]MBJ9660707.1 hypothetical protein [Burkholderia gladioli]
MLKLKTLSKEEQEKHFKLLKAKFDSGLSSSVATVGKGSYDQALIDHLKTSLRVVLLGTPAEIEAFASDVVDNFPKFSAYMVSRKKSVYPNHRKHKNTLAIINACLDYEWFSRQTNGWGAYALVEAYRLRICPYCQANHINLHVKRAKGARGSAAFQLRPPLDHYLPKSVYPYLAVSLNNLVPSCAQCNSGVKTAGDPRGKGFVHPLDATKITIRFSSKGTLRKDLNGPLQTDDVVLTLKGLDDPSVKHVNEFRLQERYNWYRHEIKDLLDRDEQHRDLSGKLQSVIPREIYVLGFLEANAEERALGLCLRDIYREIAP